MLMTPVFSSGCGDKNTKYFHTLTAVCKSGTGLMVFSLPMGCGAQMIEALNYFRTLFSSNEPIASHDIGLMNLPKLGTEDEAA